MSRTSTAVKNRWNKKAYDAINLRIPKGQKQVIETFASDRGESVNGLINRLIQTELGLTDEQWKHVPNEVTAAAMEEADRITSDTNVKGFTSLDELFAELKS